MSTHVKMMADLDVDERDSGYHGGVVVTPINAMVGHWRQLAEEAAHALYKTRPRPAPDGNYALDRVMFQFDAETAHKDLLAQAREAFLARWKQLHDGEIAP